MRPVTFSTDPLRQFLRKSRIATLPQLKQVLGTDADITAFRKLKEPFLSHQLLSPRPVLHPRRNHRPAEAFVNQAPAGCFAAELEEFLHVPGTSAASGPARQDHSPRVLPPVSVLCF
jgi:hypothetical protein